MTPLEQAVHAGDYDSVVSLLRAMSPDERQAQRKNVASLVKFVSQAQRVEPSKFGGWGPQPSVAQLQAGAALALICGTARDAATLYYTVQQVIALGGEFRPPALAELGSELIRRDTGRIHDVQRLIGAGLVARPDSDEYTIGLLRLFVSRHRQSEGIEAPFTVDPGLKDVLLRIMEFEGTSDANLAAFDKYTHEDWRWSTILLRLVDLGFYSRALLIDRTLGALERDWPQFRSGWFSAFHEKLAPTIDEMTPHLARYLALLGSRIPPTVTFALDVVKQLDAADLLAPGQLLAALRPVASSAVKAQVDTMLKLLDRVVKRDPTLAGGASDVILPALAHESGDVQKQVLRRLESWGMDESTRHALGKYTSGIAAVHRDALARLSGAEQRTPSIAAAPAKQTHVDRIGPLDPSRQIAPLASLDDLVERTAYVFENSRDIDELERVLGALVQAAPLSEQARQRFAPVAKRLPKLRTPFAHEVGRTLLFLLTGERIVAQPRQDQHGLNLADQHLIRHVDALMDLAAQGKGVVPLTTPTHARGFIDPEAFVERVRAHIAADARTPLDEQAGALLRLAPESAPSVLKASEDLPNSALVRALRYAFGEEAGRPAVSALFAAAARIRSVITGAPRRRFEWFPRSTEDASTSRLDFRVEEPLTEPAPDPVAEIEQAVEGRNKRHWFEQPTVGGSDEGFILYYSTLVPSDLEAFFHDGAAEIAANLDWWAARWYNAAYLRRLLDPTVAMAPMATLLLALGLAGKEPGQTAIAVDALAQAQAEGRLDASLLATTIRDLLRANFVTNARYAKSLQAALRIDGTTSSVIVEVLLAALDANPAQPLKDTPALLELLLEIAVAEDRKLSAESRAALANMTLSGKGDSLRKSLLKRG